MLKFDHLALPVADWTDVLGLRHGAGYPDGHLLPPVGRDINEGALRRRP
jgi:hypothetical protein